MTNEQIKRYNDLYQMMKLGKAILPNGTISQKLSDFQKIKYEFRISAPSCGNAPSCKLCNNFKICY